ncbi:hypothetical protein [Rhizobium leguminosarum]|uniref:hypothetical protein n=1 Tax=Rhizobium leguminosarum TaxID=384 RepID=UPI0024B3735E|nr:hypothetical protein [Rhizobium leguminosarum]WHO78797.1 hypothetical protein QMO81_001463 [Rhizobium leguminosarum]
MAGIVKSNRAWLLLRFFRGYLVIRKSEIQSGFQRLEDAVREIFLAKTPFGQFKSVSS